MKIIMSYLPRPEITINRPLQRGWKNILPQHNPGFMRVVKMDRSRLGKIDHNKAFWVAGI